MKLLRGAALLFAFAVLGPVLAACTDGTTTFPESETVDGGTASGVTAACADTGFNPDPCRTEAGHTYSIIQNAGAGGTFAVVANATMDFSLNGGGTVTIDCQAGSTCDITLNGGSATIRCAATASCAVTCNGGAGTLTCDPSAGSCKLAQLGGQCVQR